MKTLIFSLIALCVGLLGGYLLFNGNTGENQQESVTVDTTAISRAATDSLNEVIGYIRRERNQVSDSLDAANAKLGILPYFTKMNLLPVLNLDTIDIDGSEVLDRDGSTGIMYLKGHLRELFSLNDDQTDVIKKMLAQPAVLKAVYHTNISMFMRLITDKQQRNVDANFVSFYLLKAMTQHTFAKEFDQYQTATGVDDLCFGGCTSDSSDITNTAWNTLKEKTGKQGNELEQMYLAHLFMKRRFAEGGQPLIDAWVEILIDLQRWFGNSLK